MYKIAIIGHRPEDIRGDWDTIHRAIKHVMDKLYAQYEYGKSTMLMFNLIGERGVGQAAIDYCIEMRETTSTEGYKYHIFLPFMPDESSKHWYDEQKEFLNKAFNNADATTIAYPSLEYTDRLFVQLGAERSAIDNANFVVAFWTGQRQGKTFEAIEYALMCNKLTLNGLNDLRMITNEDIRRKVGDVRK